MKTKRQEILAGIPDDELLGLHDEVAEELERRGVEVAHVIRPRLPIDADLTPGGFRRRTVRLPGLAREMFEQDVTAGALARRTGVGEDTVGRARNGTGRTRVETARKFAAALGVPLEKLRVTPPFVPDARADRQNEDERGAA